MKNGPRRGVALWRFVRLLLLFRSDRNLWKYRWHYLKARNDALESEVRTLREKLRQTKKYLRDANRGAQTNALVAELAIRRRAKPNMELSHGQPPSPPVGAS